MLHLDFPRDPVLLTPPDVYKCVPISWYKGNIFSMKNIAILFPSSSVVEPDPGPDPVLFGRIWIRFIKLWNVSGTDPGRT